MPDKQPCPCEGRSLNRYLQPTILAILAERRLHGYAVVERLAQSPLMSGAKPDRPGVYRTLGMMEQQGLLTHAWTPSQTGPAKRTYALTSAGRVCLTKWTATLDRYSQEIADLVEIMRRSLEDS